MPAKRNRHSQSSERDVALVQMQIAAQARNERWYEFLSQKRDDLRARLRQQGYTQGPTHDRPVTDTADDRTLDVHGVSGVPNTTDLHLEISHSSARWGNSALEPADTIDKTDATTSARATADDADPWWHDSVSSGNE